MEAMYRFEAPSISEKSIRVYDAECAPFCISGLMPKKEDGRFARMPREVAERVNEVTRALYCNTAGGRLRFATDSPVIALSAVYGACEFTSPRTVAVSGLSAFCFDLYADGEHVRLMTPEQLFQAERTVSFELSSGRYESLATFREKRMREITLYFPSFVNVEKVYIGLAEGAILTAAKPYRNELPVVFYGSSITHGACASRPGNTYPAILSRRFGFDYVNLGFAGGCRAEDAIIEYLCGLPMQMLFYDYDHNTPSLAYLEETHLRGARRLRAAHPEIPMVLLSKPNRHAGREEAEARLRIIEESYRILKSEGAAPVHFVSGQDIFTSHDSEMMTVDNTHPTDFGFFCMAEALSEILKLYF